MNIEEQFNRIAKEQVKKIRRKNHKGLIITLIVIVAVLAVISAGAWSMFGIQLTAAMTIEKKADGLWSMEYKGDYGFDGFLAQGSAASDVEMADYIISFLSHSFWKPESSAAEGDYGCSALAVKSSDGGMQDTERPDLTITSALRLMLDKAATIRGSDGC